MISRHTKGGVVSSAFSVIIIIHFIYYQSYSTRISQIFVRSPFNRVFRQDYKDLQVPFEYELHQ